MRDVLETMPELATLRVDGGASANDFLCQLQADQVGVPVERPELVETTALGAAYAAGLATGFWSGTEELSRQWLEDKRWEPAMDEATREKGYRKWKKAVERTLNCVDVD